MRCAKNEARSSVWEVPAEGVPALNMTWNGKPYGIQPWREQEQPRRIRHGRSLNCAFEYSMRTQERQRWFQKCYAHGPVRNFCDIEVRRKNQSCLCHLASALKYVWTHSFPTCCQYNIHMSLGFSFLYSFMTLDFTSTSNYKLWRLYQEFRSYFFHIIFFKITVTSGIHSIMHKNRWYSYHFTTKKH